VNRYWLAVRAPAVEPLDLLRLGGRAGRGRVYYGSREGWEIAGMGEAAVVAAAGADRFAVLAAGVEAAVAQLSFCGDPGMDHRWLPQFVGGFGFGDAVGEDPSWRAFGAARLVLPEITMVRRNGDARLVGVAPAGMTEGGAREFLARTLATTSELLEQVHGAAVLARRRTRPADPVAPVEVGGGLATRSPAALRPVRESALESIPLAATDDYEGRVEQALAAIAAGEVDKLVLARAEEWSSPSRVDAAELLDALATRYPGCFRFCVQPAGGDAFVGASPERLVKVEDRIVWADALAGTRRRAADPEEDRGLAEELLGDDKERREHAAVVDYLRSTLGAMVPTLEAADEPSLLRLNNVQHLHTRFRGSLSDADAGAGVIELASRVHPTPAVAGVPQADAIAWLADNEGLHRGWYAGAVGTVAPRGEGEFCVAIRCGLLSEDRVRLFAGAGIVRGSQPEREQREVEQKLRGLRDALLDG